MSEQITRMLGHWRDDDPAVRDELIRLVYHELQRIAAGRLRREVAGHTLSASDLVHEAFARLVDVDVDWQSRTHFYATAARAMRRILVDHARAKLSHKRGGDQIAVTLTEGLAAGSDAELLELNDALERLNKQDQRKAQVLELHYFGGLTYEEISETLSISAATVDRDLRMGKAWLARELAS